MPVVGNLPAYCNYGALEAGAGRERENQYRGERGRDMETHRATELGAAVWTFTDNAKCSRRTLSVSANLELATFLSGHG